MFRFKLGLATILGATMLVNISTFACLDPQFLEYSCQIPPTKTNWESQCLLPKFDQTLGELSSVELKVESNLQSNFRIESLDSSSIDYDIITFAKVQVALPDNSTILSEPSANLGLSLPSFDGTTDFDGLSGKTIENIVAVDEKNKIIINQLNAFVGQSGDKISLPVSAKGKLDIEGSLNYNSKVDAVASTKITVKYIYCGLTLSSSTSESSSSFSSFGGFSSSIGASSSQSSNSSENSSSSISSSFSSQNSQSSSSNSFSNSTSSSSSSDNFSSSSSDSLENPQDFSSSSSNNSSSSSKKRVSIGGGSGDRSSTSLETATFSGVPSVLQQNATLSTDKINNTSNNTLHTLQNTSNILPNNQNNEAGQNNNLSLFLDTSEQNTQIEKYDAIVQNLQAEKSLVRTGGMDFAWVMINGGFGLLLFAFGRFIGREKS